MNSRSQSPVRPLSLPVRAFPASVLLLLAAACAILPGGESFYAERPFTPPRSYAGGVVVTEIFVPGSSGLEPVVEEIAEYFPRTYQVVLAYHMHVPPPRRYRGGELYPDQLNPLAGPDGLTRAEYYGIGKWDAVYVDGEALEIPTEGGQRLPGTMYAPLKDAIERDLKFIPPVAIDLDVNRDGGRFAITATVTPQIDMSGHDLVLRLAVVETASRSLSRPEGPPGAYSTDDHPWVVRYMPGGAAGYPISFEAGAFTVETGASTTLIASRHHAWLTEQARELTVTRDQERIILQREELGAENLFVVAFVQREQDRRILQAAVWYPE